MMQSQEETPSEKFQGGLLEPKESTKTLRSSTSRKMSSANADNSFVLTEGPHKTIQCLVSPPPRNLKKSWRGTKILEEADIAYRNFGATLQTIERFLKLDTTLEEAAVIQILKLVKDPTLTNILVVKKIRVFFPGKVNLWQGLSAYIMKSLDPTKIPETTTKTSETDGSQATESTKGSSQGKDDEELRASDKSKNSSSLPDGDAALNTNLSRSRSMDAPDTVDEAAVAEPGDGEERSYTGEERSPSGSSLEAPLYSVVQLAPSPTHSEIKLVCEGDITSQTENPPQPQRQDIVGKVLDSIKKQKSRTSSKAYAKFIALAMRIRRGVVAIREMVKVATEMRNNELYDDDESIVDDDLTCIFNTIRTISHEVEIGQKNMLAESTEKLPCSRSPSKPRTCSRSPSKPGHASRSATKHDVTSKSAAQSRTKVDEMMLSPPSSGSSTDFEENALAELFGGRSPSDRSSYTAEDEGLSAVQYDKYGNEYSITLRNTGQIEFLDGSGRRMTNISKMMQEGQRFYDEFGREIVDIFALTSKDSKTTLPSRSSSLLAAAEKAGTAPFELELQDLPRVSDVHSPERFLNKEGSEEALADFGATTTRRKFFDERHREILNAPEYVAIHKPEEEIINIHGKEETLDIRMFDEEGLEVVAWIPPVKETPRQSQQIFNERGEEVVHTTRLSRVATTKRKSQRKTGEVNVSHSFSALRLFERVPSEMDQRNAEQSHLVGTERLKRSSQQPGDAGSVMDLLTNETQAARKSRKGTLSGAIARPPPAAPLADIPYGDPVAKDGKVVVQAYMEQHGIYQLFEMFLNNLVMEQPKQPLDYLIDLVRDIGVSKRREKVAQMRQDRDDLRPQLI